MIIGRLGRLRRRQELRATLRPLVAIIALGTALGACGKDDPTAAVPRSALLLTPENIADTAAMPGPGPTPDTVKVGDRSGGTVDGLTVGAISYDAGASGWLGTPTLTGTTAPAAELVLQPSLGSLSPGTYHATVVVNGANAAADSVTIALVVLPPPPKVVLSPTIVLDTAMAGRTNPPPDTVQIANGGGGTLDGLTVVTIGYGAGASGWLGTPTLTATSAPGAALVLQPTISKLTPGTYRATVLVNGTSAAADSVTVTLVVEPPPVVVLTPKTVTDSAVAGGANPAPDTVQVTNGGGGTLDQLAVGAIGYGPGASGWLGTPTLTGTKAPGAALVFQPVVTSLAPGSYEATVRVDATNATADSVTVTLVVTSVTSLPAVIVLSPKAVADTTTAGGANPTPDTVRVTAAGGQTVAGLTIGPIGYGPGASGWLGTQLTTTTAPAATLILVPQAGGLSAGIFTATVPVSGTNAKPDTLTISLVVAPQGSLPPRVRLDFASYVAGQVRDVAVDGAGNVIVAGGTVRQPFVPTPGVFPRNAAGTPPAPGDPSDVFVMKLTPSGQVIWAALLGGPGYDRAYGVEVDAQGYIYVAGRAGPGFPVTPGAFQTTFMGGYTPAYGDQDGFVCKLTPDGTRVVFCSYFGTSDLSIIRDVAVDPSGNVYLASAWTSGAYPAAVQQRFLNSPHGGSDAVIAKIAPNGSQVLWARYIGGSGRESNENSVRVDGAGNPYLLLTTESTDAPTPGAAQPTFGGGSADLYLTRLSATDGSQVWATYIGGSGNESTETHELAVATTGEVVVAAPTTSTDFPTTPGALQRTLLGGNDLFIARYANGGRLLASTLLGGISNDRPEGVTIDAASNIHITGTTESADFPITPGALQPILRGGRDGFVVILPADLRSVLVSTFFGGNGEEYGRGIAVGPGNVTVIGGTSTSTDLPGATGTPRLGFVARFTSTNLLPVPSFARRPR